MTTTTAAHAEGEGIANATGDPRRRRYDLGKATDRALRHVHVSSETACTTEAFEKALKTGDIDHITAPAVRLFLSEGDEHSLVEVVTQKASSFGILAKLAHDLLPPGHPTILFLTEPPL